MNWYVIYTRPKCERKVANLLTKKKIENYCPYYYKFVSYLRKIRSTSEPLFPSYIFVFVSKSDLPQLKQLECITSIVSWKSMPAVVTEKEIQAIKDFTSKYRNIKLEKMRPKLNSDSENTNGSPTYTMNGKVLKILNKSLQVQLPSLGFTMVAEAEEEGINVRTSPFEGKEFLMQS